MARHLSTRGCDASWQDAADNLLIAVALIGPLLLLLLYKWYYTLDSWYVPWGEGRADYFDSAFDQALQKLYQDGALQDGVVYLLTDSNCPCSAPVIQRLTIVGMAADKPSIVVHDIRKMDRIKDAHWLEFAQRFPALPSALVMRNDAPLYIGPVIAGNLCSRESESILPFMAMKQSQLVMNWLAEGCYCAVQSAPGKHWEEGSAP